MNYPIYLKYTHSFAILPYFFGVSQRNFRATLHIGLYTQKRQEIELMIDEVVRVAREKEMMTQEKPGQRRVALY